MHLQLCIFLICLLGEAAPIGVLFIDEGTEESVALHMGALMATYAFNEAGGIDGRRIHLVKHRLSSGERIAEVIRSQARQFGAAASELMTVFGLENDRLFFEALPALEEHHLLSMGQLIGSSHNMFFTRHAVFTNANSYLELVAMVNHAVTHKALRRLGLMTLGGTGYAEEKPAELRTVLKGFGLSPAALFSPPASGAFDYKAEWSHFAERRPQAVLVFAPPHEIVRRFIRDVLVQLSSQQRVLLLTAYHIAISLERIVDEIIADVPLLAKVRQNATIFSAVVSPRPDSVRYEATRLFREQYDKIYHSNLYPDVFRLSQQALMKRSGLSIHVVGSWLAYMTMIEAFKAAASSSRSGAMFNGTELIKSTFSQRIFTPGGSDSSFNDFSYGIFSENCGTLLHDLTGHRSLTIDLPVAGTQYVPSCRCNQGSHTVSLVSVSWDTGLITHHSYIRTPLTDCDPHDTMIARALVLMHPSAGPTDWQASATRLYNLHHGRFVDTDAHVILFKRPNEEFSDDMALRAAKSPQVYELLSLQRNYYLTALTLGEGHLPIHSSIHVAIIDPIVPYSKPWHWLQYRRNVISLLITYEQELRALAGYAAFAATGSLFDTNRRETANEADIIDYPVYLAVAWKESSTTGAYTRAEAERLASLFRGLLATHLLRLADLFLLSNGSDITHLKVDPGSLVVLAGVGIEDFPMIQRFLEMNTDVMVAIPFGSLLLRHYDAIVQKLLPQLKERVLFATALPHWKGQVNASVASPTMKMFYGITQDDPRMQHPYALASFLQERVLQTVAHRIVAPPTVKKMSRPGTFDPETGGASEQYHLTSERMLDSLYSLRYVTLDEKLSFGPFNDDRCHSDSTEAYDQFWRDPDDAVMRYVSGSFCERNWASTTMYVRSLAAATDPTSWTEFVYEPDFYKLIFDLPKKAGLAPLTLGLIVAFAIVPVLVVAGLLLYICLRKKRNLKHAPKDSGSPVTILFTDIQSSTALWAEIPEVMGPALDVHHSIMRELIELNRGYEVKTIGDSFMVAFSAALDAVAFSCAVQRAFFEYDWRSIGGEAIDACYNSFEAIQIEDIMNGELDEASINYAALPMLPRGGATAEEDEELGRDTTQLEKPKQGSEEDPLKNPLMRYFPCHLTPERYCSSWRGLRIRIGMNTGFADIKLDEVTQAYDYYGQVTNVAARTESAAWGGQVVATEATRAAVEAVSSDRFAFSSFGPQLLRGVAVPVGLCQVSTIPGRFFGPLRLDRVCSELDVDDTAERTETSGSHSKTCDTNTSHVPVIKKMREEDIMSGFAFLLLTTLFSTCTKKHRTNEFGLLCRNWRVNVSKKQAVHLVHQNPCYSWKKLTEKENAGAIRTYLGLDGMQQPESTEHSESSRNVSHSYTATPPNLSLSHDCQGFANFVEVRSSIDGRAALIRDSPQPLPLLPFRDNLAEDRPRDSTLSKRRSVTNTALVYKEVADSDPDLVLLANKIASVAIRALPRYVRSMMRMNCSAVSKSFVFCNDKS